MSTENKNYYLKKSIEISEESKKTIVIDTSIIFDIPNDNELGKEIRRRINEKIGECNKHINQIKDLLEER